MIQPMNQTMSMNAMMYPLLQCQNFSDSVLSTSDLEFKRPKFKFWFGINIFFFFYHWKQCLTPSLSGTVSG